MTKKTSIVLLCVITVIALFFGIFAFILDGQALSKDSVYNYHNAYSLIQKSGMFGDTVEATYKVKVDENTTADDVIKVLKTRLQSMYGYYSVDITEKDGIITINLPKTAKSENASSNTILSSISRAGKVELLSSQISSSLPSYDQDNVVLSNEHLRGATTRTYTNGGNTYYICQVKTTKEGTELIKKAKLTEGTTYAYAIDGVSTYMVVYQNGQLQFYSPRQDDSKVLASFINKGSLGATLSQIETNEVENKFGWIFAAVMGVVVLATFIFFAVRYKALGIAAIVSQLVVSVAFVYIAAWLVSTFNLFAAIALCLAYAFMTFFSIFVFERIRAMSGEKTFSTAAYYGFHSANIVSLIAHGALLVLGIILWVIPTAVTAPMGMIFVCGAILSFIATFALNRLFVKCVEPFCETSGNNVAKK